MAFQDKTKANVGFKKIVGKAHTSNTREHFNEAEVSGFTLSSSRIFAEKIDSTPSNNVGISSDLVVLYLESVSGVDTSYVAKLGAVVPSSLENSINPLTGILYSPYDRVGNIIPESFGDDFRPILKNNGTEVPPLDSSDWFIDTFSGIVTQEDDGDSPLLNLINGTIECYVYIGNFIDDTFEDINSLISSISGNLQSQIIDNNYDINSLISSISGNLQSQIIDNNYDIDLLNSSILTLDNNFSNSISNLDQTVVHLTGSESISGNKTFIDNIYLPSIAISGNFLTIDVNGKVIDSGINQNSITMNGVSRYDITFDYSNISGSGILNVTHNLGNKYCSVTVIDNIDKMIIPDEVSFVDNDSLMINLNSFGSISGLYKTVIIG